MRTPALIAALPMLLWALSCGEPFERGPKQINYVPPEPTDDDDDDDTTADDDDVTTDDDDDITTDDDDDITTTDDDDDDTTFVAPTWAEDAHPVLIARCQVCHQNGGPGGSSALVLTGDAAADYLKVVPQVDPDNPDESALLVKASGRTSHGGQTVLAVDSADYQTLLDWIAAGAAE